MKRVMTIARRTDGTLVIHNAIALADAEMAEIDAWGKVATIVVPNGYHRLDAKIFHDRYPGARVVCPAGSRTNVRGASHAFAPSVSSYPASVSARRTAS